MNDQSPTQLNKIIKQFLKEEYDKMKSESLNKNSLLLDNNLIIPSSGFCIPTATMLHWFIFFFTSQIWL